MKSKLNDLLYFLGIKKHPKTWALSVWVFDHADVWYVTDIERDKLNRNPWPRGFSISSEWKI